MDARRFDDLTRGLVDNQRFDNLARTFASRVSRRTALRRGGAGIAAGLLGAAGLALPAAAQGTPRYARVRRYQLATGTSTTQLFSVLQTGFLPMLQQQAGFLEYSVIDGGTDSSGHPLLATISAFQTKAQLTAADQTLASWVQQNLASLLPLPTDNTAGNVVVHAEICPAPPATPTPTPTATTVAPTATATAAPTATATATSAPPTATTGPCTGNGCACHTGTQSPCDQGLICCATNPGLPGGPGVCKPNNECVCTDPSRPGVGCSCITGTQNPCGATTLLCCSTTNLPGGPGTCTPASVGCQPLGSPTATSESAVQTG